MEDFRDFYYGQDLDDDLKAAQDRLKGAAAAQGIGGEVAEVLLDYVEELVDVKIEVLLEYLRTQR